ncbi:MAG: ribonuclease III [Verrucomicrobiae bacterium]|nr:ribonuclease III [Verrucomicrobiae bacterium]MDW7981068.1 ribonuclease III [Verrucomicrobiales bacterium]
MPDVEVLQQRLGYRFHSPELLGLALTHPSAAHERGTPLQHNQRLEFLGDAVLQLVLSAELYTRFPTFPEGVLTKARARLVNRRALAEQGRQLGLGEFLELSRGEEQQGGRNRPSSLADAFEAVIGAIFLDGGLDAARAFVLSRFGHALEQLPALPAIENPKGELQELLQARSAAPPHYKLVSATGPDHDRVFECTVEHEGVELGRGRGKSKKEAEAAAALAALEFLRQKGVQSGAPDAR